MRWCAVGDTKPHPQDPHRRVIDTVAAERAWFAFEVCSDHYFPWLDARGHASNAALATMWNAAPAVISRLCPDTLLLAMRAEFTTGQP